MRRKGLWLAVVFLAVGAAASAAVRTAAFRVEGMNTEDEVRRVTNSLNRTAGVLESAGDARSQVVMVKYDDAKARAADLSEAVDIAGFTLSPLENRDPREQQGGRIPSALGDINSVMGQTSQALENERFGLARNLAIALKVRKDGLVTLSKGQIGKPPEPRDRRKPPPPPPPPGAAEVQQFSKAVDDYAAAAEVRDKPRARDLFRDVKRSFRRVVEAYDLDSLLAAPPPPSGGHDAKVQEKSLTDQLKDLANKYM
jgi:copper chaperone CopZ